MDRTATATPWLAPFVNDYLDEIRGCLDRSVTPALARLVAPVRHAVSTDRAHIYALGNGGSSAIARAFSCAVHDYLHPHLRRTRLTGSWSTYDLMAEVASAGFEQSAVRLLERDGVDTDDLVVLLSGSGNSRNLVAAARYCQKFDVPLLSFTGRSGGQLGVLGVPGIRVDSTDQQVVEDCVHAAIHLLLAKVDGELTTGNELTTGIGLHADAAESIDAALQLDVDWIDQVSDELARAAAFGHRVTLIAPEGGPLGLAVEHVAHNLNWDLPYRLGGIGPTVRCGVSLADYTGVVNDSGEPGTALWRIQDGAGSDDVTLVFANDADHPAAAEVRAAAAECDIPVYGLYGDATREVPGETVAVARSGPRLLPLTAQVTGHVLMRAARAKVARYRGGGVDLDSEELCARSGVAPLLDGMRSGHTGHTSEPGAGYARVTA